MAKSPHPPGVDALASTEPAWLALPAGTILARVYYTRSRHALAWNAFRHAGPVDARWDHHPPNASGEPTPQRRSIYYCATDAKTCLAECFQVTRRIDRAYQAPWLVVFELAQSVTLVNLREDFATRMGASMAIHSGSRARARAWARALYEAFPQAQGILYDSSMNSGAPAVALNDRAEALEIFPTHPLLHRALADDAMVDMLKTAAAGLGYGLR
ncbi:MAG: RES family NAD+ phosphorylase [Proteobacteria bacterium]|nr:RES family NAD+ phosphorylase [Pseudomonadota bacterium]